MAAGMRMGLLCCFWPWRAGTELLGGSFPPLHLSHFIALVISAISWIPIPNGLRVDVPMSL